MRRLLKRQASGIDPPSPVSTNESEDDRRGPRADRTMASNSTGGGLWSIHDEGDDEHHGRVGDGSGRISSSSLRPTRRSLGPKGEDALTSKFEGTSSVDFNEDVESQPATAANSAPTSRRQARNSRRETGSGGETREGGNGGGFAGYGSVEAGVDEGEPLLREEVADYIDGVDFRDGTGPSALPPNDVARAFRDAEDFALLGRGLEFWSRLTGDDHGRDHHHPQSAAGGGRNGLGRVGKGGARGGCENGRRRRVVYVESATTGKFFKVYEGLELSRGSREAWGGPTSGGNPGGGDSAGTGGSDGLGGDGHRGGGGGDGGSSGSFGEDEVRAAERLGISVREVSFMRLNKGLEAIVLFVQGALAGLTLASIYMMALAENLESFVGAYEAQAGEFRRAMYFLCSLALMGTEDQLLQAKSKGEVWSRLGWWGRLELRVCVFLYGGCLVSSLVCSVVDTGIANAYGSATEGWYATMMAQGNLRQDVLMWYGCNLARFVLSWTGWFLVCRRRWRVSLFSDYSQIELKDQRERLSAAEEQISRLNGRNLDPLTTKELQELTGSLKRALDNAERMIGLRL